MNLTYIAMSAAIMAVCAFISVPIGVSVTMQTFGVLTVSALFGARIGVISVMVYLILGAVGLPVFSGFRGGLGHLMGPGGGYLFGFILTALIVGLLSKRNISLWLSMTLGVAACYVFGTVWYAVLYGAGKSIFEIVLVCALPFIPFDIVKIALSVFSVKRLKRTNLTK